MLPLFACGSRVAGRHDDRGCKRQKKQFMTLARGVQGL
jgi:hypothetical protein